MSKRLSPEFEMRVSRAYQAGNSSITVAREYGLCEQTVLAILERTGTPSRGNGKAWSRGEDEFLREHYNVDRTASEIAIAIKRTRNSVIGRAGRLGLSQPINSAAAMEGNQLNKASAMRA